MPTALMLYSTTDGHTIKICDTIAASLSQRGYAVELRNISSYSGALERFDKILIGASIRYGKHKQNVVDFINLHADDLADKGASFFTVNLVARKPEKQTPENNPYLSKFLKQLQWQPRKVAVFAGKLNYPIYKFWDKQMIRFIMWITKGPTDPSTVKEFTDWQQVERFAQSV